MFEWVSKLLPSVEKRRLLNQCDKLDELMKTILYPSVFAYTETCHNLGIRTTTSKYGKDFEKAMLQNGQSYLDRKYHNGFGYLIEGIMERANKKVAILRKLIDDEFQTNMVSNSLTFKQVNIVRLVDLIKFWCDYSIRILHQVIWEECEKALVGAPVKPLVKAQLQWVDENRLHYYRISAILAQKDATFVEILEKTSDIILTQDAMDNAQMLGLSADPFKIGFMPVVGDFILFIRERSLAAENDEYEANKTRLQTLQLQLQALRIREQEGEISPALLKQIEYQTNRIQELEYKVEQYERKAGV